jgi:hypothetical protein
MEVAEACRGEILHGGGFSNQSEIMHFVHKSRTEFNHPENPWRLFIEELEFPRNRLRSGSWAWKAKNALVQEIQLSYFLALLNDPRLSFELKIPTLAWMLSEMLHEVPPPIWH